MRDPDLAFAFFPFWVMETAWRFQARVSVRPNTSSAEIDAVADKAGHAEQNTESSVAFPVGKLRYTEPRHGLHLLFSVCDKIWLSVIPAVEPLDAVLHVGLE